MAQIDASIPLGVRPAQIEQPINQLAKILQIQNAQQESQLGKMKMDEYQRKVTNQNALSRAIGRPDFDWSNPAHRGEAFSADPSTAQELYKGHVETQDKVGAGKKRDFEMAKEGYSLFNRRLGAHFNNPNASKAEVLADVQSMVQLGLVNADFATRVASALPDDPVALKDHLKRTISVELPPEKMLEIFAPKPTEVSDGQQKGFRDTNPNSPTYGQPTAGAPVQMQMTPGEAASDQRARTQIAEQKRHNTTMEGFRSSEVGGVEYKQDSNGNWLAFPKKAGPGPIQPRVVEGVPGKREASARNVLTIIKEAETLIDGATGSYLGAAYDEGARAFGKSTDGAQATAQLKALEGQLMMAMPRMEGPQSNLDVMLYRQMAGQIGDPTVPRETKKAALTKIKSLQQQYVGGTSGATGEWGAPAPAQAPASTGRVVDFGSLK
jgi:hypothetical protein